MIATGIGPIVHEETDQLFILNVSEIIPSLKHETVFKNFNELVPGEAFGITNDHDPKPLYYQMLAELGSVFTWEYLQKGADVWRVCIKKNKIDTGETVGEIAAKDMAKAEVFRKFGIDFCCGGRKTLEQACNEKGIAMADVEAAFEQPITTQASVLNFNDWDPAFLADYIFNQHHKYYYNEEPAITILMNKVFEHHGSTNENFVALNTLYFKLKNELDAHFIKEEVVVFPFIKSLAASINSNTDLPVQPPLSEPIQIMESEHEAAGDLLAEIRKVTNNYVPQQQDCNSIQLLLRKLELLEADLHQHIHLENNILFPKALQLERQSRSKSHEPIRSN